MALQTGLTHRTTILVDEAPSAERFGNAGFAVLATPALVALLEQCCIAAIAPHLEPGRGAVGMSVQVEHLVATPVGFAVTVGCTLTEVEGRVLGFTLEASDGVEVIARATHRRAVVDMAPVMARAAAKRAAQQSLPARQDHCIQG